MTSFTQMFFPQWAAKQALTYQQAMNQPALNFLQDVQAQGSNAFPSADPTQYQGLMQSAQNFQNSPLNGLINAAIASKSPDMIPAFQKIQSTNLANQMSQQKMNMFGGLMNRVYKMMDTQGGQPGTYNPNAQRGLGIAGMFMGIPGSSSLVTNSNQYDPSMVYGKTNAVNNANAGLDVNGNPTTSLDQQAQGIGTYTQAPPSGRALATPAGRALMDRVRQLYPDYDEKNYQLFQKTLESYGSGTLGDITRRMSVAVNHSDLTSKLIDQLNNGSIPAINTVQNYFLKHMGYPAPNNLEAAKLFLTDEVTRGMVGPAAGEGDRERLLATISSSHSMDQLKGVVNTFKAFLSGQLKGLRNQYTANTHRSVGDFNKLLLPGVSDQLDTAEQSILNPSQSSGQASQAGWPKVGTVMNGWTYNGGDPHDQGNWTK